jgi:hypothetical protein
MSQHASTFLLGRYAILQNNIFAHEAQGTRIGRENRTFFARFSHRKKQTGLVPVSESQKLIDITLGTHESFFTATTVFPFVLFPDTISIDRQKVTIVHRSFFRVAKIASLQVRDIINVEANVGPLFGSVTLTSRHFLNNTQTISFLKRRDIVQIQRLIQGFIIANRAKIDTAGIEKEQLVALLNNLGQGSSN